MHKQKENREKWFNHIREYEASSLSQAQFCRENNLLASTFYYYRQQYLAEKIKGQASSADFVELSLPLWQRRIFHCIFSMGLGLLFRNSLSRRNY